MASVSAEEAPILKPYMTLASHLGRFLGQTDLPDLNTIKLEFDGRAASLNEQPVLASMLAGLLGVKMDSVNMVNAASVASLNGIAVATVRHDRRCDYETLLRLTVSYASGERTISGTLVGGDMPRLVEVQGISIESDFPQNMLYLRNYDKPGFIGTLGMLMGELNLNIASFHLGRKEAGGEAVALVEIDGSVDKDTLGAIRDLPQIVRADYLRFA
jgi:D-3-phosphoglycerate dehydrogenase